MAAHRYWRAVAMEAYGAGDLELSCFHLLDAAGVRVDAPATLTASAAPATGALANLQDDDLTTAARWTVQSVATLALNWDFGVSSVEVADMRLAGDSNARFPLIIKAQYSDDSVAWADVIVVAGIAWPGVGITTVSPAVGVVDYDYAKVSALLHFDGANGSTTFTDLTGRVWTPSGTVRIDTAQSKFGGASSFWDQSGTLMSLNSSDFDFEALDFTVECWAYQTSAINGGAYFAPNYYQNLVGNCQIGVASNNGFNLTLASGKPLGSLYNTAGTADTSISAAAAIPLNTWVHLAFVRKGTALTLFVGGAVAATGTFTGPTYPTTRPIAIGGDSSGSAKFAGYLDEVRVTKGLARYTGAFAPPGFFGYLFPTPRNKTRGRIAATDPLTVGTGPTIIYGIPTLTNPVRLTVESGSVKDYITGVRGTGRGRVAGTVKEKGTPDAPVYRKVRLLRERDSLLIREVWSHPVTGAYSFDYVDELQLFTVLSYDHTGAFRAVVADRIVPELIP